MVVNTKSSIIPRSSYHACLYLAKPWNEDVIHGGFSTGPSITVGVTEANGSLSNLIFGWLNGAGNSYLPASPCSRITSHSILILFKI